MYPMKTPSVLQNRALIKRYMPDLDGGGGGKIERKPLAM
jgi:hypothetical protein